MKASLPCLLPLPLPPHPGSRLGWGGAAGLLLQANLGRQVGTCSQEHPAVWGKCRRKGIRWPETGVKGPWSLVSGWTGLAVDYPAGERRASLPSPLQFASPCPMELSAVPPLSFGTDRSLCAALHGFISSYPHCISRPASKLTFFMKPLTLF